MSDGIQQIGQKLAEEAISQQPKTQPKEPEAESVAKFEEAMQGNETTEVKGAAQEGVSEVKSDSLGDQILQGIQKLKESHEAQIEKVNQLVNKEGEVLSVQDALKLQLELMRLSHEQELVAKSADKSSQAVQTMMRNQ